jgi:starvation-inducible outer membrane lipoprotein
MKIFAVITLCLLLTGCETIPLKDGELYLNEKTSVGMKDFGVAKVRNHF